MGIVPNAERRAWGKSRTPSGIDFAAYGHAATRHVLPTWQRKHLLLSILIDLSIAVCALVIGPWLGALFEVHVVLWGTEATLGGIRRGQPGTLLIVALMWPLVLAYRGAYARRFVGAGSDEYRIVLGAAVTLVAMVAIASFVLRLRLSREGLLVALPVLAGGTLFGRYVLRRRLARARLRGECLRPALLVGDARAVLDALQRIIANPRTTGLHVAGVCVSDPHAPELQDEIFEGIPILGGEGETLSAVDGVGAKVVAVTSSPSLSGTALRRLGWALEQRDVDLMVAPGIIEVAGPRLSLRPASGLPMLHVERPVCSGLRYSLKLAADRCVALVALIALSPVLAVIALLIRRDSPGPALFRQERVGEGGRVFSIIKFRTMRQDAATEAAQLADGHASHDGNEILFKLRRDPRVTRVGTWLRRYSLDELPQLMNVVRGEMSLIGPRPPLPSEVARYESDAIRRLRVRPGITGLWQVSGRSDLSWVDSVRLDLWYVDNWSLALDAQILVRTVKAVVRARGAY